MTSASDIQELKELNNKLYRIANKYARNSSAAYNLLTAYDRIFDGIEALEREFK